MGEAKRRKKLDPNFGKGFGRNQKQRKQKTTKNEAQNLRESDPEKPKKKENEAENLIEYVKQKTLLKGRGYLAYAQGKCIYYGKEDYLGDEDDTLKAFVHKYNVETQVVLVRQTVPGSALFATEIVSLESLKNLK